MRRHSEHSPDWEIEGGDAIDEHHPNGGSDPTYKRPGQEQEEVTDPRDAAEHSDNWITEEEEEPAVEQRKKRKKGGRSERRSLDWITTDEESGGRLRVRMAREKNLTRSLKKPPQKTLPTNTPDDDLYESGGTLKPGGAEEQAKRETRCQRLVEHYQRLHKAGEAVRRAAEPSTDPAAKPPKKRQRAGKKGDGAGEGKMQCAYMKPTRGSKGAEWCKNIF